MYTFIYTYTAIVDKIMSLNEIGIMLYSTTH